MEASVLFTGSIVILLLFMKRGWNEI
jgi:hypothetical protein